MTEQPAVPTNSFPLPLQKDQVDRACLETLGNNARRTLLVNVLISILTAAVIWFETGTNIAFFWLAANVLVCAVRFLNLLTGPASDVNGPDALRKMALRHVIGAAIGGIVWGVAAILFLTPELLILDAFIIICVMGIATGASASLSPHFPTFLAFVTPIFPPLILQLAMRDGFNNSVLALMGVLFTIALISSAKVTNRTLRNSFEEKFKSDALAKALESSRDELEKSEKRFRGFAESASDWFWEMDDQLRINYISGRFEAVTGIPSISIIGKTRQALTDPQEVAKDAEKWRRHFDDLNAHRPFRDFQYELVPDHPGPTVAVSISGVPIFSEPGLFQGYRGTGTDVSELHEIQRNLIVAKEEAETANSAKSDFLSSMSHELRTPLNAILGFTQLLQIDSSNPLTPEQTEQTEQVIRSGHHLLELVDQVLELAKIEARKTNIALEPVSVHQMLQDSIAMIQPLARRRNITVFGDSKDWPDGNVLVDRTAIRQVLLNFLSNAVKYNHDNGSIYIKAHREDDNLARIEISDTGSGIPKDRQVGIFEPFNRLGREASEVEGTGIGLVITRELLLLMNSEIGFQSEEGKGSTFWFDVPYVDVLPIE